MKLDKLIRLLVLAMLLSAGQLFAGVVVAAPVAQVEMVDGIVHVTRVQGKRSILAVNSSLSAGDMISTEKDSYARLRFIDGGEVAIRPVSSLLISEYRFTESDAAQDSAILRLLKGGLRTVTGLVGKRGNQDAYRLQGGTATIGIRGTEFIARLCDNDCRLASAVDGEKKPVSVRTPKETAIVARLAEARATVFAIPVGGSRRLLKVGDPLYATETLDVAAQGHAVLVFADTTRVVLHGGSQYVLAQVRYPPRQIEYGMMSTDLIKGGLRMVTGLLGRSYPEKIKVTTQVATIGIRGTNFDIVCAQSGSQERGEDPLLNGAQSCDQALYAQTRDGVIELRSGGHKLRVDKGQVAYIDRPGALPGLLKEIPLFLRDNPSPRPEELAIDMRQLFGSDVQDSETQGLYVEVKEGKVTVGQEGSRPLLIEAGEAAFAGLRGESLFKLNGLPSFMEGDPWLREMRIDPEACRVN